MAKETRPLFNVSESRQDTYAIKWARRRDIPLTILAWFAVFAVIIWAASHITQALLLLAIAALFAYALAPIVKFLERIMPRFLAILIVYMVVLGAICFFFYFAVVNTIHQTRGITDNLRNLLIPDPSRSLSPFEQTLTQYGISPAQIAAARQQLLTLAEDFARNSLPFLRSLVDLVIDTIIVAILSIYLLIDGSRVVQWARANAPKAMQIDFLLSTLQRIVGGYIRGQATLAALIGVLVWIGMEFIFHLQFAVFLGFLAFAMAFVPVLGTLVSGALCVLIGLTHGWLVALGVLSYFVIIHVIEGEAVGPRIVGQAIGLHPVVSLFALVAGAELFGIWGALFASPIAGILQALIISLWTQWRETHPEQFYPKKDQDQPEKDSTTPVNTINLPPA